MTSTQISPLSILAWYEKRRGDHLHWQFSCFDTQRQRRQRRRERKKTRNRKQISRFCWNLSYSFDHILDDLQKCDMLFLEIIYNVSYKFAINHNCKMYAKHQFFLYSLLIFFVYFSFNYKSLCLYFKRSMVAANE